MSHPEGMGIKTQEATTAWAEVSPWNVQNYSVATPRPVPAQIVPNLTIRWCPPVAHASIVETMTKRQGDTWRKTIRNRRCWGSNWGGIKDTNGDAKPGADVQFGQSDGLNSF